MNSIPKKLREEMSSDPFYTTCARNEALHDHECTQHPMTGRLIEWEHSMIVAGRQLQQRWAIIPICWWAHSGPGLVKRIHHWIALNRATDLELLEISRLGGMDYFQYRFALNQQYGTYAPHAVDKPVEYAGINYGYPVEKDVYMD